MGTSFSNYSLSDLDEKMTSAGYKQQKKKKKGKQAYLADNSSPWCFTHKNTKRKYSLTLDNFSLYSKQLVPNRPFPSSLVPLFQKESKCETIHMKMSSACSFIFMQIKVIFIMVSQLDSLWNRGTREVGNGLLLSLSLQMSWRPSPRDFLGRSVQCDWRTLCFYHSMFRCYSTTLAIL